jgi:hypothetical protein
MTMTFYYAHYNDNTVLGLFNNDTKVFDYYFTKKSDAKKTISYHIKKKWWLKDIRENTVIKNINL